MCTGRVDLAHVFRAFFNGNDGVYIGGCHLNECNFITHGNYHAINMVLLCKRIMEYIGLNPGRLRTSFTSSAEGMLFKEYMNDFNKTIKEIGPLGKSEGLEQDVLKTKIDEVMKLIPYIKVMKNDKLGTPLYNPEEYDGYFTKEEVTALFNEVPSYYIEPEKCQACTTCARRCPVDAIISAKQEVHIVEQDKCIKCGTCIEVCPPKFKAVLKITGSPVPPPLPEGKRGIIKMNKDKGVA